MAVLSKILPRASRYLSLLLRHKPEAGSLTLDRNGWAAVPDVLAALRAKGYPLTDADLRRLVAENDKARFAFSLDGHSIRAQQGHSIEIDLGLEPVPPPETLFHGTVADALLGIRREGIVRGRRHHVHLSGDHETARKVGARRGKPVILPVKAATLHTSGQAFYRSGNGVWLTDRVPPEAVDWTGIVWG